MLAACVVLAGCSEVESAEVSGYDPAKVEAVPGQDGVVQVTFTQEGADRTGLETAPVQGGAGGIVVPYASLIYDPEGKSFVYQQTDRLSFMRVEVVVERIDGRRVLLSEGPPVGSQVVTVGWTEVYGAELEIDGSH